MKAALALEEAWNKYRPEDTVKNVDVLSYTPALYRMLYSKGYVEIVEHAPKIYGALFRGMDNPKLAKKFEALRRITLRWVAKRFGFLLDGESDEAVSLESAVLNGAKDLFKAIPALFLKRKPAGKSSSLSEKVNLFIDVL